MSVFQKILDGALPADVVYEDDQVLAFRDVAPQAPVHVLVIPKVAFVSLHDAPNASILGHLLDVCRKVAAQEGLAEGGYRVVTNVGADGGQTVPHMHCHVIGGRPLGWPPG